MPSKKKSTHTKKSTKKTVKTTPQAKKKVAQVMKEYKEGDLHSGSGTGPTVKSRKQAIAIALHEAGISRGQKKSDSVKKTVEKKSSTNKSSVKKKKVTSKKSARK